MSVRLAVDIGGTFTDVVLQRGDELTTTKVLTTYDDPANGVMQGIAQVLAQADVAPGAVELVLHGTTLATNALIERRGAATALLTTAGHRDVLEMAFENRFEQYDVNIDRPAPLVNRRWRVGIPERLAADGEVLAPLDESAVLQALEHLVEEGATSIAVGFLHSYVNPGHEQRVGALIAERYPQLSVTLSSAVCPEIREYERISTTVANAYVKPLMASYLASLSQELKRLGIASDVLLMTSGGGLTTLETAAAFPIRLVESGPAGGAILAAALAARHGLDEVLSFDMGGTTAKICLIDGGQPLHSRAFEVDRSYRFKKGSGLPVRIPVIEMVEIGAGGGSVAHVDGLKRVQVGPESAGSEPGPACYDRGGSAATVTDADVVLGKLDPNCFAGGKLRLDAARAGGAVADAVAAPLAQSIDNAAFTIAEIVEENMASAARAHAAEWGRELPSRSLIAFGGAAPLHAAGLARKLHIDSILVPAGAGVGSALGFLLAPVSFEVVRSLYARLEALLAADVVALLAAMREEAGAVLDGATGTGKREEAVHAYMRYAGQGYEIAVAVPGGALADDEAALRALMRERFEHAYADLYGRIIPGMAVEVLSWTLALTAPQPAAGALRLAAHSEPLQAGATISHYDGVGREDIAVRLRDTLTEAIPGPVLVVEAQTTVIVPGGMNVRRLEDGALLLESDDD